MNTAKKNRILITLLIIIVVITGFVLLGKNKNLQIVIENTTSSSAIEKQRVQKISPVLDTSTNSTQKTIVRNNYSFQAPKDWVVGNQINFEGCLWDVISIPSDGHELKGEVGIYPKSCFDITKSFHTTYAEKNGYYITVIYDRGSAYENEVKQVYTEVINTFTLK